MSWKAGGSLCSRSDKEMKRTSCKKSHKKIRRTSVKQNKKGTQRSMNTASSVQQLPIPPHFNPNTIESVRKVDYEQIKLAARDWRKQHNIKLAARDNRTVTLLIVDAQNTFCIPGYELYVGGRSGKGAIDDNRRLCQFIYRNLGVITSIAPTMDTHLATQIFHEIFFINADGNHPIPFVDEVSSKTLKNGTWKVNPEIAWSLSEDKSPAAVASYYAALQGYAIYYCETLEGQGKFALTIWPYHAMLMGIGHAVVAAVDEACFFHNIARASQTKVQIKGGNPLTENYSILRPELLVGPKGMSIGAQKNVAFINTLLRSDRVIIAGQAKSHCVAWTIADLLSEIKAQDPALAEKVYLMEDCTSAVTVPNPKGGFYADYTDEADKAFARFAQDGMHIVKSTDPVDAWPNFMN